MKTWILILAFALALALSQAFRINQPDNGQLADFRLEEARLEEDRLEAPFDKADCDFWHPGSTGKQYDQCHSLFNAWREQDACKYFLILNS